MSHISSTAYQFNVPLTKLGTTLKVELDPANPSFASVVYNGLKQALNDTLGNDPTGGKAELLLARILAGEYVHRDLGEGAAPKMERFLAEAARMVVTAQLKAKGIARKDVPKAKWDEFISGAAKHPKVIAKAEELRVIAAKAVGEIDIELDF